MGNFLSPFFLVSSVTTFVLGIWVISINSKSKTYIAWFLFCFSVALWSSGLGILTYVENQRVANIFYLVHYLGAIHIPIAFLYFVRVYYLKDSKPRLDLALGLLLAELQLFWFINGDLVGPLSPKWEFSYYTNPGKYYIFYMTYFSFYVAYSFFIMLKNYSKIPNEKTRKLFFIIATGVGYTGGSSAFLLVYFNSLPPFGIIAFPLFPILTTYAIVRHKFMDIDVLIKRTLIFAGLFAMAMIVVSIVGAVTRGIIGQYFHISADVSTLVSILITILLYKPTQELLIRTTDKFLFQRKQEIKVTLNRLSEQVTTIADVDQIAKTILSTLRDAMRLESGMMILQNKKQSNYHIAEHFGFVGEDLTHSIRTIVKDLSIASYFSDRGSVVNLDYHGSSELPKHVLDWLDAAKVRVVIPLFINDDKFGLMVLGKKKSDQEFKQEEIDYFPVIASQTSLAIRNALLIQDVVHEREAKVRAEHLAERVKFARTIKHEIKNKLTNIDGPARLLKMYHAEDLKKAFEAGDRDWFYDICKTVSGISEKISSGVQIILDIAETSLGGIDKEDLSLRRISLKVVWDDAKEESGQLSVCAFESSIPEGFAVYANYYALQRVFVNLICNAADAMKDNEKKNIKLRCDYKELDGQRVAYFEFEDSGMGMTQEVMAQIFKDGFSTKAKPLAKDLKSSGHGQGLFACKNYIERIHSGKIWAESTLGGGTIFRFWIPLPADF